jgi:hypothetical protein
MLIEDFWRFFGKTSGRYCYMHWESGFWQADASRMSKMTDSPIAYRKHFRNESRKRRIKNWLKKQVFAQA